MLIGIMGRTDRRPDLSLRSSRIFLPFFSLERLVFLLRMPVSSSCIWAILNQSQKIIVKETGV